MSGQARAGALLALGLLQMAADVAGARFTPLKGLAMATAASPAPRVFSSIRGYEPYSTRFHLEWRDRSGMDHRLLLTPEVYERLQGAYNRRNAYGAALAAAPVLLSDPVTEPMLSAVLIHALCGEAAVMRELGIDPATIDAAPRIRYEPVATSRPRDLPHVVAAPCP